MVFVNFGVQVSSSQLLLYMFYEFDINHWLIILFSMYPLFIKDGLIIPYFATLVIYIFVVTRAFIHKDLKQMKLTLHLPLRYLVSIAMC